MYAFVNFQLHPVLKMQMKMPSIGLVQQGCAPKSKCPKTFGFSIHWWSWLLMFCVYSEQDPFKVYITQDDQFHVSMYFIWKLHLSWQNYGFEMLFQMLQPMFHNGETEQINGKVFIKWTRTLHWWQLPWARVHRSKPRTLERSLVFFNHCRCLCSAIHLDNILVGVRKLVKRPLLDGGIPTKPRQREFLMLDWDDTLGFNSNATASMGRIAVLGCCVIIISNTLQKRKQWETWPFV